MSRFEMCLWAVVFWLVAVVAKGQQLDEVRTAELCRQAVLGCQLPDGSVAVVGYQAVGRPALIEPYFANLACAGVLAAEQHTPRVENRKFVARWLTWYADRQAQDNGIYVYDGTWGADGVENVIPRTPDSLDSYAGLYCYVAGRYASVTNMQLEPEVIACCLRMLKILEGCRSPDGLFWNFPPGVVPGVVPAQYLLDNAEVYQGLREIAGPLKAAGYETEANLAWEWERTLAIKLSEYWSTTHAYYVVLYGDLAANVAFGGQPLHAEGLATVSALALFDNVSQARRTTLWTRFQQAYAARLMVGYQTTNYTLEDPTIERVYLAALRSAAPADLQNHRQLLLNRASALLERNRLVTTPDGNAFPYCHRFGMMIIGLLSPAQQASPYLRTVPLPIQSIQRRVEGRGVGGKAP